MTLTTNIGTLDRVLRLVLGVVLIGLAATGVLGAWAWIGVVPLVTAFLRICPAYSVLGIKTCADC